MSPCNRSLFHHFAKRSSPIFVRCDKIAFFTRTRELFPKKLLYFSVKSVILYPTGASVGYKAKRRAFLSGTPVVHPSIIMLFSSFTFLSFTLSRKGQTKNASPPARGSVFCLSAAHHRKAPCTFHGTGRFAFQFYSAATAALSSSTRSVFSHFTPRSSRPMWP